MCPTERGFYGLLGRVPRTVFTLEFPRILSLYTIRPFRPKPRCVRTGPAFPSPRYLTSVPLVLIFFKRDRTFVAVRLSVTSVNYRVRFFERCPWRLWTPGPTVALKTLLTQRKGYSEAKVRRPRRRHSRKSGFFSFSAHQTGFRYAFRRRLPGGSARATSGHAAF